MAAISHEPLEGSPDHGGCGGRYPLWHQTPPQPFVPGVQIWRPVKGSGHHQQWGLRERQCLYVLLCGNPGQADPSVAPQHPAPARSSLQGERLPERRRRGETPGPQSCLEPPVIRAEEGSQPSSCPSRPSRGPQGWDRMPSLQPCFLFCFVTLPVVIAAGRGWGAEGRKGESRRGDGARGCGSSE